MLLSTCVSATLLAGLTLDKDTLAEKEIALLTAKISNNSAEEVQNVIIRLQAGDGFVFAEEGDKSTIVKNLGTIAPNGFSELRVKIKCISTKTESAIYAYYGLNDELNNAAVIKVKTKAIPISVKTEMKKTQYNNEEAITITYSLQNHSSKNIYKIAVEAIAPKEFEVTTAPQIIEVLAPEEKFEKEFLIMPSLEAKGDYELKLAYGFFDENAPHYFEESFPLTMQRQNYQLIGLLGFIVLIIAAYLFLKKGKANEVKGTAEKK
jgi:hypothetical protein